MAIISKKTEFDDVLPQYLRELARAALDECRTSLMMAFRFMDTALWKMPFEEGVIPHALSTDGMRLYFSPRQAILRYHENPDELARDYLHSILHCIFRQPFDEDHLHFDAWSLACDVTVEAIAMEMCGHKFTSQRDADRKIAADKLRRSAGSLTPYKLYAVFKHIFEDRSYDDPDGLDFNFLMECMLLFIRDDHSLWACLKQQDDSGSAGQDGQDSCNQDCDDQGDPTDYGLGGTEKSEEDENFDGKAEFDKDADQEEEAGIPSEEDWEEIAKQVQSKLEQFTDQFGQEAALLAANLTISNRKKVDYVDFLKRFATFGEDIRVNDDEFDYIFYMYGLDHYGNMPLVEPLEYKETKRVREFVIALDTSGSCEGELIETFVARTSEILNNSEGFGDTVNIHIVQCDAEIKDDTKITTVAELEEYGNTLEVKGFGGTDFRPVFDYVGDLIAKGEFENLQGLIYFTDGIGLYPDIKPPYDVAFVFVEEEGAHRKVPPWAMKVVMNKETVRALGNAEQ